MSLSPIPDVNRSDRPRRSALKRSSARSSPYEAFTSCPIGLMSGCWTHLHGSSMFQSAHATQALPRSIAARYTGPAYHTRLLPVDPDCPSVSRRTPAPPAGSASAVVSHGYAVEPTRISSRRIISQDRSRVKRKARPRTRENRAAASCRAITRARIRTHRDEGDQ